MSLHGLIPADLRPEVVARLTAGETAYLNVVVEVTIVHRMRFPGDTEGGVSAETHAPPAWVELAEATCETCDGSAFYRPSGHRFTPVDHHQASPCAACEHTAIHSIHMVCPGCHQGKPIHTISVPLPDEFARNEDHHNCPECGGFCALYAAMHRRQCSACNGTGTVEVKAIVRKVVPVVDRLRSEKDGGYVIVMFGRVRLYPIDGNGEYKYITVIGPEPAPGDHIAVIEAVRS